MRRAVKAAYWTVPSLLCVLIYWLGLKSWFQQDDFAWLAMNRVYRATGDLWPILFEPKAQGTIRPLSERLYFIALRGMFGLDPLPFRVVAFATDTASVTADLSWRNELSGPTTATDGGSTEALPTA